MFTLEPNLYTDCPGGPANPGRSLPDDRPSLGRQQGRAGRLAGGSNRRRSFLWRRLRSCFLVAWAKAILLAFFVLYIIWMALLLYHTVNEAGVITAIGQEMPGIAHDRPAQALLLAWIFGSFLQGATGFGVPAAVVAPLLLGMGFAAGTAVVIALLGHAWAVTFGSLGSSFISMIATTGVPGAELAGPTAALLAVAALGCGLGVLWLVDRWTAVRRRGLFVLLLTLVMGGTQWAIAASGLWTLAALGAGLAGLLVAIPLLSRQTKRNEQ